MPSIKRAVATCLLSFAILVGAVTTVSVAGCHSPTQQKIAVKSLYTVHKTTDALLDGYLDLVVSGNLSTNKLPVVLKSYDQFQNAYNAGLEIVIGNTNATPPQSVLDAAANFANTVTAAKKGSL